MPKTLSNILHDLEEEIHILRTCQDPERGCCGNLGRAASNGKTDSSCGKTPKEEKKKLRPKSDRPVASPKEVSQNLQPKSKEEQTGNGKSKTIRHKSGRPASSPEAVPRNGRSKLKEDQKGDGKRNKRRSRSSSGAGNKLNYENTTCCCAKHIENPPCICGKNTKSNQILGESNESTCCCAKLLKDPPSICCPKRKSILKNCICALGEVLKSGSITTDRFQGSQDSQRISRSVSFETEGIDSAGLSLKDKTDTENLISIDKTDTEGSGKSSGKSQSETLAAQLKQTGDLAAKLQAQVDEMQRQMLKCDEEKLKTLNASNEMKNKFEKMRTEKSSEAQELEKLKKAKEELAKQLQKQEERRRNLEEKTKEATEKTNKSLTEKVEQVEIKVAKSAKKVQQNDTKLTSAVKQQDNDLRKLAETSSQLADSIRKKDIEIQELLEEHNNLVDNLQQSQFTNMKLAETNLALIKSIKDFKAKLQENTATIKQLQMQMTDCKKHSKAAFEELERLKERLRKLLKGPTDMRELERLRQKIREAREREQKYIDEEVYIKAKLKELENIEAAGEGADDELDQLTKEHRKLQAKCEELMRTITFVTEEHSKKIAYLEAESKRFEAEMAAKEAAILKYKADLQSRFNDLTESAQKDKSALDSLLQRVREQENLIKSQLDTIAQKTAEIKAAESLIISLKAEIVQHTKDIAALEISIKEETQAATEAKKKIESLTQQLDKEKLAALEKDNRIAQTEAEMKGVIEKSNFLQNELSESKEAAVQQQERNTILEKDMEMPQGDKLSVTHRLTQIEATVNDICEACQCTPTTAGDGELVKTLENKIDVLEREAALKLELVQKQKDQVLKAAQFAIATLIETVGDFHEQAKTHKNVHYMLTKRLEEKKAELQMVCPGRCYSKKNIKQSQFQEISEL